MKKKAEIKIFLAHAKEDEPRVQELYRRLNALGYSPWLDKIDLIAGQQWREEIPKAIKNSNIFIACLSNRAMSKQGYIQNEFKLALEQAASIPKHEIYIIPLKFDECQVPQLSQGEMNLADFQWLNYWEEEAFEKLVAALEYKRGLLEVVEKGNRAEVAAQYSQAESFNPQFTETSALEIWQEKLAYFQIAEAIAADNAARFELGERIEECKQKIRELGGAEPKVVERNASQEFRHQVQEYLSKRHIEPIEIILLNTLRDELGLIVQEAERIIKEEEAPILRGTEEVPLMDAQKPQSALETWQEKLEHFQRELAIASDAAVKFEMEKQIEECFQKIKDLKEIAPPSTVKKQENFPPTEKAIARSKAVILTGQQREILRKAILGAYPNPDDLMILLSEKMDVQLGAIARGDAYNAKVFSLIQDFEANGSIEKFIRAVVNDKPQSPYLESIKKEFAGILGEDNTGEKINSSTSKETMENRTPSFTPAQRLKLRQTLRALIVSDLNDLIDALQVPKGIIPPSSSDAASRVDALWGWAESPTGIGLNRVQAALDAIINPLVVVPSTEENLKGNSQVINNEQVTEWKIVLNGELSDLSLDRQEQIINTLKEIGKDSSLKLKKINIGSIVLILEGSEEGFKVIQALYKQGILTEIHGLPILKVEINKSLSQNFVGDQVIQKSIANYQINTSKVPKMHILHLSDLHFGTSEQARLWSNQLVQDLRNELSIPNLDALILSGDIANKSTKCEYEAAQQFLDSFRADFPLAPEQITIVPGNHDLNWEKSEEAYTPVKRKDYQGLTIMIHGETRADSDYAIDDGGKFIEQLDKNKYQERFTYFGEFYQAIKNAPYPLDYDKQYTLDHFPTKNLLILGLNSAWQLDHHYKSRASINMNALSNALTEIRRNPHYNNCLKIAVWHHPLDSAGNDRITDRGFMEQLVVAGFRFFLHGHIHQAETSLYCYDMSGNGRTLDRICAGTFGAATRELVPGYPWQYNLLKFEADQLIVETRRREQENGAWKPDARWSQGAGLDPLPRYTIAIPEYALEAVKK
jgi:3',5'-cyclic AMP phosphodiesterase CpdA